MRYIDEFIAIPLSKYWGSTFKETPTVQNNIQIRIARELNTWSDMYFNYELTLKQILDEWSN
mgnify:FL=1